MLQRRQALNQSPAPFMNEQPWSDPRPGSPKRITSPNRLLTADALLFRPSNPVLTIRLAQDNQSPITNYKFGEMLRLRGGLLRVMLRV
jgi:hypothetical protein